MGPRGGKWKSNRRYGKDSRKGIKRLEDGPKLMESWTPEKRPGRHWGGKGFRKGLDPLRGMSHFKAPVSGRVEVAVFFFSEKQNWSSVQQGSLAIRILGQPKSLSVKRQPVKEGRCNGSGGVGYRGITPGGPQPFL